MTTKWTAFEDKLSRGDWRAEAIDHDDEGACYVTIFAGPNAQRRAEAYAASENGK